MFVTFIACIFDTTLTEKNFERGFLQLKKTLWASAACLANNIRTEKGA